MEANTEPWSGCEQHVLETEFELSIFLKSLLLLSLCLTSQQQLRLYGDGATA